MGEMIEEELMRSGGRRCCYRSRDGVETEKKLVGAARSVSNQLDLIKDFFLINNKCKHEWNVVKLEILGEDAFK
ncbi:hypothetical protein C5167_008022 [Papaver somniferum]|uniref:Uncharacterized protein n=1 Tax=Papaver somniferum TaxID=3469 RepID=A0A4Y7JX78_PAPSO|nr:hypothetical protein C5167_008022 [Papaver somniferum]